MIHVDVSIRFDLNGTGHFVIDAQHLTLTSFSELLDIVTTTSRRFSYDERAAAAAAATREAATIEAGTAADFTPAPVQAADDGDSGIGDSTTHVPADRPPPKPRARAPQGSKYDWAEVADVINTARRNGQSSTEALAAEYDATRTTAQWMVSQCRKRGHEIVPATNAGRRPAGVKPVIVGQDRGSVIAPAKVVMVDDDDDQYEPLTWGVNGESPPKVEHWSRHEER